MTADPMPWAESAACRGTDPDLWFPDGAGRPSPRAEAICGRCPVFDACFDHALRRERHGIWAATTERQRARMRRAAGIRLDDDLAEEASRLVEAGTPPRSAAEVLGVNVRRVYRLLERAGAPHTGPADHRRRQRGPG